MNTNTDDTFVIEPLVYQPTVGAEQGRFIDMRWETEPSKNGDPRKDLVLVVELEKKDDTGQPFQVPHAFNMLPRGRGKAEFKKQMESFLETPLTPAQLAGFKKDMIIGKQVTINYKEDHLEHVVFDRYTPAKPTEPTAAA